MNFSYPSYVGDPASKIHNKVTAGESYVLTLDIGKIVSKYLDNKRVDLKKLEDKNFGQFHSRTLTSDILHSIGLSYFAQLDMFNELLAKRTKVEQTRINSVAITSMNLNVSYMLGQPHSVSGGGVSIDVDRNIYTVKNINGNDEKEKNIIELVV